MDMPATQDNSESQRKGQNLEQREIRTAALSDRSSLISLIQKSGLFPPDDFHEIETLLDDFIANRLGKDHLMAIATSVGQPVGVAYYAPERMTSGTWNLYMLVVHPERQGEGHGRALVRHVEEGLSRRGERLLLIETAGLPSFEPTRNFYRRCGYREEARIRDFYDKGVDKVIFLKSL